MKSRKLTCIAAMIVFVTLAIPLQLIAQHTRYTVTDLGTLDGTFSVALGLNNRGDVEGLSTLPGDQNVRAFFWRNGVMIDLGTLGGPNSFAAWRPSETGAVGGTAETATPDPLGEDFCGFGTDLICLPFVWQNGAITPLPTLGDNNGNGNGMNSRGQVAGVAENTTLDPICEAPQVLQFKPVIWTKREVQELPTFPGDPEGFAGPINDRGEAAGASGNCTTEGFHALLWQEGSVTDLGNLGGTMGNIAIDINNQGQIVGRSNLPGDTTFHAFLWQNGVMTDLRHASRGRCERSHRH